MPEDKKAKRFDLSTLDTGPLSEEGRPLEVMDPETGEPLGITIILRGAESDTYKRAFRAQVNKRMNARQGKTTIEQLEAEAIDLLAACTVGWTGIDLDGQEFPFSRSNAVTLYGRFGWLKKLVDSFVSNEANYRRD